MAQESNQINKINNDNNNIINNNQTNDNYTLRLLISNLENKSIHFRSFNLNNLILYITKSESKLLNTIKLNQTDQIIEMKDDSISTQHCALFLRPNEQKLESCRFGINKWKL